MQAFPAARPGGGAAGGAGTEDEHIIVKRHAWVKKTFTYARRGIGERKNVTTRFWRELGSVCKNRHRATAVGRMGASVM